MRNASLSQMNHLRKQKTQKTFQLVRVKRIQRLATVLYLNTGQGVHLNLAAHYALKVRRVRRELVLLRHPDSFRNIFPGYKRVDFDSFPEPQYRDTFRMPKDLCVKIWNFLTRFKGFGRIVRVPKGRNTFYTYTLEELVLIYLRRLALPDRLLDVAKDFGRCPAEISRGSLFMCHEINSIAKEYLDGRPTLWWNEATTRYNCDLVNAMDVPLRDVCIFIDGTHEMICNPWCARVQRLFYSGYIRHTSNKLVAAVCPQGLFMGLAGPAQGRRHDMAVALLSNLYRKLHRKTQYPQFQGKVYGDSAFRRQAPVYTPYHPSDTPRKALWNRKMAAVRISVEWGFQVVKALWPSNNFVGRQKIMQGRQGNIPGKNFYNSVFLTNLHSCHKGGNLISDYFGARMPTVEEYLGLPAHALD